MIGIDKKVLDSIQESVQAWDAFGRKLFSNNKASLLYELEDKKIQTIEDILHKWSFFDQNDKPIEPEELPAHKVIKSKQPINDTVLKMVGKDVVKWIKASVNPILNDNGDVHIIITTCLDITHLKLEELKYKNIANYDLLTKLPNRLLLSDRLELAIANSNRSKTSVAICMIDIDGFKALNDTFGHDAGDALLVEISRRMKDVLRDNDTVARLGGDEFVVILTNLSKSDDCTVSLYRLLNTISSPYMINGNEITTISASIGVSLYPDDKVEPDTLMRHADIAMYKSKNSGKNRFSFFDIATDQKIKANHKAINKIKNSILNGEFCLYYQPKINSATDAIVEIEALARWSHHLLGIMSPSEFLPLIENDSDLSDMFDDWVINEAVKQLHSWYKTGLIIKICINISPRQFKHQSFPDKVKDFFIKNGVGLDLMSYLEFEIIETAAVDNLHRSNKVVQECKKLGITFALDDFGTGYSSLVHLKELNIDTIKIDKTFVSGMLDDSENMAIVQAIGALASAFDIKVTAEGAENIEQVISLIEMGCDEIQGYAIAKPMPAEEVKEFICKFTPDPRWKIASQTLPSRADFELLLAESNHKYWVEMVIAELSKKDTDKSLLILDHKQCRFGKWFEQGKQKKYKVSSNFKELDSTHQKIHQKAKDTFEILQNEQRAINKDEIREFQDLSKQITQILNKLRQEIEKTKQQQSVVNKILLKRKKYGKQ